MITGSEMIMVLSTPPLANNLPSSDFLLEGMEDVGTEW